MVEMGWPAGDFEPLVPINWVEFFNKHMAQCTLCGNHHPAAHLDNPEADCRCCERSCREKP